MFPSFLDSSAGSGALPRQAPSPIAQQHQGIQQQQQQGNTGGGMNGMNGMNGMGGMGVGLPMNAGHQMDLNVLYNQMEDLSVILKENRDKTQAIIASAEELAVSVSDLVLP